MAPVIIRFFDLESTDLSASWGRVLCGSYVDYGGDTVTTLRRDARRFKCEDPTDDNKLAVAIRDALEQADIIVSWNGILFDAPFLNARLQVAGHRPLNRKTWPHGAHLDLMYYAGGQSLKIGSRKLDNVAKYFGVENQKTPLVGKTWQQAAAGVRPALDKIVEHCEADVLVLRDVFPLLAPHVKKLSLPLSKWYTHSDGIVL